MCDAQYEADITEAGRRVERMRHGNNLERTLWLINEKASWACAISGDALRTAQAVKEKLDQGVTADLGPAVQRLDEILGILTWITGAEPGTAESLDLSFGEPEPKT